MGIIEVLAGPAAEAIFQRLSRRRSDRVAINVVGQPPFGRLPNYFLPGIRHPGELRGSEGAGRAGPYEQEYTDRIAKNSGAPCGSTHFTITVQCIGTANVALVRGRAVVKRLKPVKGIFVVHQSGGPINGFHLNVDLANRTIECVPAESYPGRTAPVPFGFQIAPQVTEKFDVFASVGREGSIWHLELDFIVDGQLITKGVLQPSGDRFTTIPMDYDLTVGAFRPSPTGWIEAGPISAADGSWAGY